MFKLFNWLKAFFVFAPSLCLHFSLSLYSSLSISLCPVLLLLGALSKCGTIIVIIVAQAAALFAYENANANAECNED